MAQPNIDCVDLGGAPLQEAIRKSTGRSTDVERDQSLWRDLEVIEGAFELSAATTDIRWRGLKRDGCSGLDQDGGLSDDLIADSYFTGHDGALCLLAASEESLLDEKKVQAHLF